jgi:hypothetical protein
MWFALYLHASSPHTQGSFGVLRVPCFLEIVSLKQIGVKLCFPFIRYIYTFKKLFLSS